MPINDLRCDNCGWSNPDGTERCQKCNQVLVRTNNPKGEMTVSANCPKCGYPKVSVSDICPMCNDKGNVAGLTYSDTKSTMIFDRSAHNPVEDTKGTVKSFSQVMETVEVKSEAKNLKATVMDITPFMDENKENAISEQANVGGADNGSVANLSIVPVDGLSKDSGETISCGEDGISLNRANVDPSNPSIDVVEQLRISYENGEWYIQDKSAVKNTYILANRKMKVERGDIVVIGNKRFVLE